MRAAREVGITTVAVAAMMFSSTTVRAQRAVGTECTSSANASVPLGPDGDCALQDASVRLFAWLLEGGDGDATVARSGARGFDVLAFADGSSPFGLVRAGESAHNRRRGIPGDDGLSLRLWDATPPGSGVGGTSFWLDVLDAALSVDWPPPSHGRAIGLAISPVVFLEAVKGSTGPGIWSEHGVQWFEAPERDSGRDRAGDEGTPNVTVDPEPGSLALITTGLAGLGGLGVRRRRGSRR